MNRQEIFEAAVSHVSDTVMINQELYLAQIIKMNPEINLLNYTLCRMPCYEEDGRYYEKTWLQEIK